MLRKIMIAACTAGLVAPVFAVQWDFPSGGTASEDIVINLDIVCYIQIDWQDLTIEFGDGDWYCETFRGVAYDPCPDPQGKQSYDPWAGDAYYATNGMYYESDDGGVIFVRSNNDLCMEVHSNGDLHSDQYDSDIPTWFTIAFCPFQIAGTPLSGHTVPLCGYDGCYASDSIDASTGNPGQDYLLELCYSGAGWPNQWCFPCEPVSHTWTTGYMDPYVEGTIKFLARILRHGMADPAGSYSTFLDVTFSTSSP